MSDDMSEMIQKMSEMIKNNEIPDNIKSIMNNLASSNYDNSSDSAEEKTGSNDTNSFIDLDTMLKMKSVIDSMNQQQNDPRTNLLKSLKPYLKPSRKEKVEQYIKLFSMGKVFEVLNPMGGDKKNDV